MKEKNVNSQLANGTGDNENTNSAKWWLMEAVRLIPAMKYAIGVVGIVAATAISLGFVFNNWPVAVTGGAVVFAGMILLRIFAALQPKVAHLDISGPAKVLVWTVVGVFSVFLVVILIWFTNWLFHGDIISFFTPEKRIEESFVDFVKQVGAADEEGPGALASLAEQYHKKTVHWEDCIVVDVIATQRTYRLAPNIDTPAKYQAMAGFGDGADFKSFKKGQTVDIEGVFDTVNPFAIILYNCRFASKQSKPKKS